MAEAFDSQWLPRVFGGRITSFVSFADIEKGEGWFERLLTELGNADAALVCLTPENLASPWMHFESGMVSRMGKGRVFTYFLGTEARTVRDPLKQIQLTVATELDTKGLTLKLGTLVEVPAQEIENRWATGWEALATALREVGPPSIEDVYPGFAPLFDRKTFNERLEECADQLWLKRYEAVRETSRALVAHRDSVFDATEPWQGWLYEKLLHQIDAYGDEIRQYLLIERPFDIGDGGCIDFAHPQKLAPPPVPRSLSVVCERRCREIRHVVFCLSSPDGAPVLPEALAFAKLKLNQFDDKKRLVHARGWRIDRTALGLRTLDDLERCARSVWDYDRIMYYKVREIESVPVATMLGLAGQELERVRADEDGSKMALHYAVKALASTIRRDTEAFDRGETLRFVEDLEQFLNASGSRDDDPVKRNLAEIRKSLESRQAGSN
jgi:hypothetical protein